ncbi:L,D-transpeptidase family protein [Desulfonatronovibrio magnus]|uniref:L,D-transpeptidase family protein n=1 Tax=Desulfonatronovibrio magnus TaxID=698827 RepID=UPI0005EBE24F|nr:L,D-transpeptidase family protein [Desulfonatronovibrio magnus]
MSGEVNKLSPRLLFFLLLFVPALTYAEAWKPHLTGDAFAPETILTVDKQNQSFLIFSNKSPLVKKESWQCTTGQAQGDKLVEGDLKTPEGIYFLERRIANNPYLPYELFGDLAFTLNYPNPVDRIKNKTGHSIWIHGRGREVVPFDTEGCVAMDMEYMLALEDYVEFRKTPVIIAEKISWSPDEIEHEHSRAIARNSLQWADDWRNKSTAYFEHYDSILFPKSEGQSFRAFQAHKQRLFNQYAWMDVFVEQPKVVHGPDYSVSYFGQVFKAPGFYSRGIKRLYWKQDDDGRFRIVGEEWRSYPSADLEKAYLDARKDDILEVLSRWREAWLDADLDAYASFYHNNAVQNNLRGRSSIVDHKVDIWGRGLLPKAIEISNIKFETSNEGFVLVFYQNYSSVTGFSDFGEKTLTLAPFKDQWKIISEHWREIS